MVRWIVGELYCAAHGCKYILRIEDQAAQTDSDGESSGIGRGVGLGSYQAAEATQGEENESWKLHVVILLRRLGKVWRLVIMVVAEREENVRK